MSENVVHRTVSEDDKSATIKDMERNGYTVVDVAQTSEGRDNQARSVVTGKNMNAKLGHIDREFID